MTSTFKRVLAAAVRCERHFDLSDDEKVRWLVERAYHLGRRDLVRQQRVAAGHRRRKSSRQKDRLRAPV